jgi:hypothetical protein
MALEFITCRHDGLNLLGEGATHPLEARSATPMDLRICPMPWGIAGISTSPARLIAARSDAFNFRH